MYIEINYPLVVFSFKTQEKSFLGTKQESIETDVPGKIDHLVAETAGIIH